MFAVISYKGKQFQVEQGQQIKIDLVETDEKEMTFSEVLLYNDDKTTKIGTPLIEKALVVGKVIGPLNDKKVIVSKFKNKIRYQRTQGHRQKYTIVEIKSIKC